MNPQQLPPRDVDARRKLARRTALWIAVIAVLVYVGFIAMVGLSK
ncbi:hypothetical protein ACFPN1_14565 [Lysobacter yangpyeongensis]|uniref:DUF2474 domain-containing protein n=1 Tax=Lysobacter yangpyeongensis TaxID=346182 RepID=A0ABW0SQJ8_9GAMM